ncbi:MAG: serpin family protein [Planctomycetes bacterium]|nr:serpin family protein [Planctomycetota bacterium]NUQ34978.1 serpin family protein [Planctomycetaceae bacterium]
MRNAILFVFLFLVTGCGSCESTREIVHVDKATAEKGNDFAFRLFAKLVEGKQENVVFSPVSAQLALSMAYNGARGETATAFAKTLGIEGMSIEQVNAANRTLMNLLKNSAEGVETSAANSVWGNTPVKFKPEFRNACEKFYDAQIENVDLNEPSGQEEIAEWIGEHTRGLVRRDFPPVRGSLVMCLLNVVTFKGEWKTRFYENDTEDMGFILANGSEKSVRMMMHEYEDFPYMRGDGFEALELPYREGRCSMVVFLPSRNRKLADFLRGITPSKWAEWISGLDERSIPVGLPKFRLSTQHFLDDALKALGLDIAYGGGADFSGASDIHDAAIEQVVQNAYVEVDEEGTRAEAVTNIANTNSAPGHHGFICDRPFFFVIRDNESGLILFMAAVYEP